MKKNYKMTGVDCANCAAKMERQISKIPGVNACSLSFITQRLTIEAEPEAHDEIVKKADEIVRKIDREARIIH